jgi:hypothetical protein
MEPAMKQSIVEHYIRLADKADYGYQTYGGDAAIAALRCFRGYHPQARMTWVDVNGKQRWMTPTMLRIHAVLSRESMRPNGDLVKVREMAKEARTSPGYFSKVLERFTAWGMFASISIRGRAGGIYLWARTKGDTFERFARDARAHIEVTRIMKAARNLRRFGVMFPSSNTRVKRDTVETFIEGEHGPIHAQDAAPAILARHRGPGWGAGGGIPAL